MARVRALVLLWSIPDSRLLLEVGARSVSRGRCLVILRLAGELVSRLGWIPRRGIVVGKLCRVAGRLRIERTIICIVAIAVVIVVPCLIRLIGAEIVAVRTRSG